jgi:hypothetical protein
MPVEKLRILVERARSSERAYNVMSSGEKVLVALLLNRLDLLAVPVAIALTRCDEVSIRAMQIVAWELSDRGML